MIDNHRGVPGEFSGPLVLGTRVELVLTRVLEVQERRALGAYRQRKNAKIDKQQQQRNLRSDNITIIRLQQPGILPALSLYFNQPIQISKIYILIFFHVYYSIFLRENLAKNKSRVDGLSGVRENPNYALTGTRHFIGTKLIARADSSTK